MAKINTKAVQEAWAPMVQSILKDSLNESALNRDRAAWMAEYAHNHVMALNEDAQVYNSNGLAYNNLFNTMGIGNPMMPQAVGVSGAEQASQAAVGSADKWPALLPVALQVAAKTVGFDLVNTTPFANPTGVLPFLDYVYSNSKQPGGAAPYAQTGRVNPAQVNDENGAIMDNNGSLYSIPAAFVASVEGDKKAAHETLKAAADLMVGDLKVEYIGKSRMDGNPIFKTVPTRDQMANNSLLEFFTGENFSAEVGGVTLVRPRLVSMLENHILGYAGSGAKDTEKWQATWMDGTKLFEPMDRATGETQYPRQLSLEMFTKYVTVGTIQVAVACTLDQVHDLNKQWGIDVMKLLESAGVNELSMTINKHILSRLFALGWRGHIEAEIAEGINFNMSVDPNAAEDTTEAYAYYDETGEKTAAMTIAAPVKYGEFTNQDTEFKRVFTQILAAGNVITQRGRRGPANFVVTNIKVATALQAHAQYGFSPIANTVNQTNGSLYPVGTVGGMTIYVDPNMAYDDTRVLVGRKGAKEEPGVHFCPYLLADKVSTIAEATMSPKMWIRSRYALVDLGWYPASQYLTFVVKM